MLPNPECIFEMVPLGPPSGASPYPYLNSLLESQTMTSASTRMHVFSYAMEMRSLRAAVTSLMQAESKRRQRMLRRPKPSAVPTADCMLSKKDVAARCQVTERMIDRYVEKGQLRAYRLGSKGSCRYKSEDVERLLNVEKTNEQVADDLDTFITKQIGG